MKKRNPPKKTSTKPRRTRSVAINPITEQHLVEGSELGSSRRGQEELCRVFGINPFQCQEINVQFSVDHAGLRSDSIVVANIEAKVILNDDQIRWAMGFPYAESETNRRGPQFDHARIHREWMERQRVRDREMLRSSSDRYAEATAAYREAVRGVREANAAKKAKSNEENIDA